MTADWARRSVYGIRAKLARSLEHLLMLDEKLHEYQDSEPLAVRGETTPDGTAIYRLEVTTPAPLELSVLVGDVVHQLRSGVDHIAYALVLAAGNNPTDRTVFPVLPVRPPSLRIYGGVSDEALRRVDELQPYQRHDPQAHPLWVLHRLANVDKHRALHLTVLQLQQTQFFIRDPSSKTVLGGQMQPGPVGHGDVLGVFPLSAPMDPQSEFTASGVTFLAFGDPGPWPNDLPFQHVLEQLHQYVSVVLLPKFELLILHPDGAG